MEEKTAKKAKKPSFFKGLKAEFKKIIWPNKQSLAKQTVATLIISVFLGVVIKIIDWIIQYGVEFIVK